MKVNLNHTVNGDNITGKKKNQQQVVQSELLDRKRWSTAYKLPIEQQTKNVDEQGKRKRLIRIQNSIGY